MTTVERFKQDARSIFGTVSGPSTAYRIAVRNKTALKKLSIFSEVYGATATVKDGATFPALALITFANADAFGDEPMQNDGAL